MDKDTEKSPSEEQDTRTGRLRLHVYLAHAGIASRRASEELIKAGRVTVNGTVVMQMGQCVYDGDRVELDGILAVQEERKHYLLLNKPPGYISSMSDKLGRPLASDLFASDIRERIFNVGRLDQWSSGLLLYTNDGYFAAQVSHPSAGIEKEYRVHFEDEVPEDFIASFLKGIQIGFHTYQANSISQVDANTLNITLIEGRNREIREVATHIGLHVLDLIRVRIGGLHLEGLAQGNWRKLFREEIEALTDPDIALRNRTAIRPEL